MNVGGDVTRGKIEDGTDFVIPRSWTPTKPSL